MGARFGVPARTSSGWPPRCARRWPSAASPESAYVDNGSAFVDAWLLRACAVLGIKLVHSTPGRPQGRGKIERFFRTVRGQFLAEITAQDRLRTAVSGLAELNRLLDAWVETGYHPRRALRDRRAAAAPVGKRASPRRCHCPPRRSCARRSCGPSAARSPRPPPSPCTATSIQVDPSLARRVVELVFDPFDLTGIEVRHDGQPAGPGRPVHHRPAPHPRPAPSSPSSAPSRSPPGSTTCGSSTSAHDAGLRRADQLRRPPRRPAPPRGTGQRTARRIPVDDFRQAPAPARPPAMIRSPWPAPPPRRSAA